MIEHIFNRDILCQRKLLTKPEAAFYLGISLASLAKVVQKPDFPALVRIGDGRGRVFVNRERLDNWIDDKTGN